MGVYITGGKYRIVNFTSHNIEMLEDIYNALVILDFHPYYRQACIELGRMSEVKRFLKLLFLETIIIIDLIISRDSQGGQGACLKNMTYRFNSYSRHKVIF